MLALGRPLAPACRLADTLMYVVEHMESFGVDRLVMAKRGVMCFFQQLCTLVWATSACGSVQRDGTVYLLLSSGTTSCSSHGW